jgi:hypothetical protein
LKSFHFIISSEENKNSKVPSLFQGKVAQSVGNILYLKRILIPIKTEGLKIMKDNLMQNYPCLYPPLRSLSGVRKEGCLKIKFFGKGFQHY